MPLGLLITDHRVTAEPDRSQLRIEVAAVRRDRLAPLIAMLERWGLVVSDIRVDGIEDGWSIRVPRKGPLGGALTAAERHLSLAAACMGALLVGILSVQLHRTSSALAAEESAIRPQAQIAEVQRRKLRTDVEILQELSRLEQSKSAIEALSELSTTLPTNSWVTSLEFDGARLHITGVSAAPSEAVKHLSSSSLWTDVQLQSSASLGAGTGQDRFEITAQIPGRGT